MVIGYWALVIGHWSLVIGHWLLVIGHWLLGIGSDFRLPTSDFLRQLPDSVFLRQLPDSLFGVLYLFCKDQELEISNKERNYMLLPPYLIYKDPGRIWIAFIILIRNRLKLNIRIFPLNKFIKFRNSKSYITSFRTICHSLLY